jgi:hypothetical protein
MIRWSEAKGSMGMGMGMGRERSVLQTDRDRVF